MKFCIICGNQVGDDARFCCKCGAEINAPDNVCTGELTFPEGYDFSKIAVRYRCPSGHVFDGFGSQKVCPTCGATLVKGGTIHLYRMGNFSGMAVGMVIYIDGVPYGHIANKQSIRICVPFGTHKLHVVHEMCGPFGTHKLHVVHASTRVCNAPVYNLSPEHGYVCCKARFAGRGFRINVETVTPDTMPEE